MAMDLRGLHFSNELGLEPVVELGRITFKNSGTSVYLPKSITNCMHLNPKEDKALIIFNGGNANLLLMKDRTLADKFKPDILNLRKRALETLNKLAKKE